jgi:hypothetical protein
MIATTARTNRAVRVALALAALTAAAAGTRPYAGGWNDGSRLATVEALVDFGTMAIDDSIFVSPWRADPAGGTPYAPSHTSGTLDKLFIGNHFYSDKSPLPAVVMSAQYALLQCAAGIVARRNAAAFSYWMAVLAAGVSFAFAIAGMFTLSSAVLRSTGAAILTTSSFGVSTTALVYACAVNNHIVLLALAAWAMVMWHRIVTAEPHAPRHRPVVELGLLSGAAYAVDLGVGPMLLLASAALVAGTRRHPAAVASLLAGAAPFILLHHVINYRIGGTFMPASAVPDYFAYAGSAFDAHTLTGRWHHAGIAHFLAYAFDLLAGRRGFVWHNLPLLLVPPALISLWPMRTKVVEWPALTCGTAFMAASWLSYAALSTNHSGVCVSIRWFVPWLAPSYYTIAVWLRERPAVWRSFTALSGCGTVMGILMWRLGPWTFSPVPFFWVWVASAVITWVGLTVHERRSISLSRPLFFEAP